MEYPHIIEIFKEAERQRNGRNPEFGDRMRNLVAGQDNPRRDAYFVKVKKLTGRLNPGIWYTMTDRNGNVWDSCPKGLIFIDD
ncbi:hypothetical protein BTJ39_22415 [Izhakiella australiensis]|uniref:Uncharacterized protein n=1 Tax=Izhakiella australiensis TaxID=1926881 RepID=A0A1S8Y931_9GAMM|nr:hypothetical protein [Izhakiella australiensis]OON35631.1 hypothetical protein BTJ39_22415 [Izhakiella australiensis]